MSGFGAGLAGLMAGIGNGITIGSKIRNGIDDYKIAKVREQGIAEAKAMQEAAAPKIKDLGDEQNLTSNPQASRDPNADMSVNTDIRRIGLQTQSDASPDAMRTSPVSAPDVQDTSKLSNRPLASAAPGASLPDQDAAPAFANGLPAAPRKRFNVDGQGFDTQEEAAAYVKKQTPALHTFFKEALIPKMTEALIAQGKPEAAAAWQKYADEEQTRTNMATWGKAVRLAQFGDYTSSAQELMKLHPHFDDGYELVSAEPTKGADGSDGFTMTVKGPDGQTQKIYQDAKTITEVGLAQLSPIEMFNKRFQRQTQADTMAAKEAIDERNDGRTLNGIKQRGKDAMAKQDAADKARKDRQDAEDKAKMERQDAANKARMDRAREGWAAAAQRDANRIAAQGQYKKSVSPQEREAIVITHLASDPMFNMLDADQKKQRVADTIALLPKPAAPQTSVPNPMQQQGTPAAPAGKRGVPVFNPATGKVDTVYR
jgi:hypothetical protein